MNILNISCILILVLTIVSCSGKSSGTNGQILKSVSPFEAQKMMNEGKDLLIVDVRSPQEIRYGYIKDSVLIPFWEIAQGKRSLQTDKPILLVCAVGGKSYGVGQLLVRKGWPEIYNLSGGIEAWKREGFPL